MKIRAGFVSNSSSCSFFLPQDRWESTKCVAEYMLDVKDFYAEEGHYDDDYKKSIKRQKNNLLHLRDVNINIAFPSTNYDTHITRVVRDGVVYIYVSTCNNIDWDMYDEKVTPLDTDDGSIYDGAHDDEYIRGHEFYNLDSGILARRSQ